LLDLDEQRSPSNDDNNRQWTLIWTRRFLLCFSPIAGNESLVSTFTCEMALIHLGEFFFFCLFHFAFRRLLGTLVLTHRQLWLPHFFIHKYGKCLFLSCLFLFVLIVYHIIFLSFGPWFFSLQYLLLLQCAGGNFLFIFIVLFYLNASISSLRCKKPWLLDMEAGFKISGSNFFSFLFIFP